MAKKLFLADLDLNGNQLIKTRLENLPAHPDVYRPTNNNDPNIEQDYGRVYWNTTDKTAYFLSGYTPGTLVPIWKSLGSGSGGGVLTSPIKFSIAAGKSLGKYVGGTVQNIGQAGWTMEQLMRDIALESLSPTANISITSAQPEYNSTNITNIVSFSYTINTADATIAPGFPKLQYRRGGTGAWINITGAVSPYSHVFTNVADKASSFDYQLIVEDTAGATRTVSTSVTPKLYAAPTLTGTPSATSREKGDIAFPSTTFTINKVSPNTEMTSWQMYAKINNGGEILIGSPAAILSNPHQISLAIATNETINGQTVNGLKNADRVDVYVRIIDSVTTTDRLAFTRTFELKKFIGAKTSAIADYRTLTMLAGNTATYSFNPNPGRFHAIALPGGKTLTSVITSNNETLTANFLLTSRQIPDAGGTNRTYNVYEYTTDIPFGAGVTFYITMQA